ncbi:MAG: primosomal protein N', partial [Magnetococcales bacterium]|nr:primosomal protein N' [Magnetococcales bacterium]
CEGGIPYHGRDMAVVLSRQWQAVLLLGSATPSLESLHNVSLGKYQPLHLRHRATGAPLPQVMLVDLRQAVQAGEMTPNSLISPTLHRCMTEELANKRQILLYLDRRGYAPALLCGRCGLSMGCPHCSVSLTYHQTPPRLMCHYCGHVSGVPDYCPRCGQMGFTHFGPGTERLEKKVEELFPEHRVARLDRDVVAAGGKETMQAILAAFGRGEVDILVGTRMIAKGHHFPGLALVGVILAETGLFHPDFRGSERTFQAITQVAGRAGREGSGRVVVQSYDPGNHAITAALSQDGAAFVARELPERREVGYPPFTRLAMVRFLHQEQTVGNQLQTLLRKHWPEGVRGHVLGPAPAHLFRLRGWYRWQVLVRQPLGGNLHGLVQQVVESIAKQEVGGLKLLVDMDPYDFLS